MAGSVEDLERNGAPDLYESAGQTSIYPADDFTGHWMCHDFRPRGCHHAALPSV